MPRGTLRPSDGLKGRSFQREPRLSEYVGDVTAFVLHFEQPGGRFVVGAAGYLLINLRQGLPNRRRHVLPIAAQEEGRSLPIELADFFALAPNAMLHERHLSFRFAEERRVESDDAPALPVLQLVAVEQIDIGVVSAEEQERRARRLAVRVAQCPLLEKAAKRRKPRAGTDHHDRRAVERRGMERNIWGADGDRYLVLR